MNDLRAGSRGFRIRKNQAMGGEVHRAGTPSTAEPNGKSGRPRAPTIGAAGEPAEAEGAPRSFGYPRERQLARLSWRGQDL
jgi:hypothetical protein